MPRGYKRNGERCNPPHLSGEKSSHWKGGKIDRGGYTYVKIRDYPFGGKQGYVAEHRLIMEEYLGRYLKSQETIHHKNGDKKDNRIENLELFETRGQHTTHAHPELMEKQRILFKGKRFSKRTEFKKGQIPWNKGKQF